MATEIRRISFSHSESTTAIRNYGNKSDLSFPSGKIIRANFAGNAEYEFHSMKQVSSPIHASYNVQKNPRAVTLTFFDEKSLEQKFYNVTADFVSSALIEYCLANGIILPSDAEKRLDVTEFNICLDIYKDSITPDSPKTIALSMEE